MKLGTEDKKKVGILIGLGIVALYLFYTNVLSGPGTTTTSPGPAPSGTATRAPEATAPVQSSGSAANNLRRAGTVSRGRGDEFRPVFRSRRPEDRIDPAAVDPTLRLDVLAKVQAVDFSGGSRNIFQFSAPPPPKPDLSKEPIVPLGPKQWVKTAEEAKGAKPAAPAKAPPAPINLKYYGFSSPASSTRKTAFFLDGEEILVAAEGETVKKRYKVVRIGVNSVLMEDTVSSNQQSLPLQEDATVTGAG